MKSHRYEGLSRLLLAITLVCVARNLDALEFNEIMARNQSTLQDEDGTYSDWVEIWNPDAQAVSLDGWFLTDDPNAVGKWQFPNVTVPAGGFLLVFCSEKDRAAAVGELHTNFRLESGGEYLALFRPDGGVEQQFSPFFPGQLPDVSYGLPHPDLGSTVPRFFDVPTPGQENDQGGFQGVAPQPTPNVPSGPFSAAFLLELNTSQPDHEIRFTLNGTEPRPESDLYTAPIPIDTTTRVKARTYASGSLPSPTLTLGYSLLSENLSDFNSDLPLFIIETHGRTIVDEPKIPGYIHVIDTDAETGRSHILNQTQHSGVIGIERRGQSTNSREKSSYGFELRDDFGADLDVALLGMPDESDWVLYGPFEFDRALMRNPLMYELSNQAGLYASRTQYCEVFVNLDGGSIDVEKEYYGVYVFMERIKRGRDRVDIAALPPWVDTEPEISGGYILKMDKVDAGETGFSAARELILHVYPKKRDIPAHQAQWIENYMDDFGAALYGPNFLHPVVGYRGFIDIENFMDFHILRVMSKEPDNFVFSTYFHKPRNGKLRMGPVWDFDRSMGSDVDLRSVNPVGWSGAHLHEWWGRLFEDPTFVQQYNSRYQRLRADVLSIENIHAVIDSMAEEIAEAQERNYLRWSVVSPSKSWGAEVQELKSWLKSRLEWMDTQLIALPELSSPEGYYESPLELTLLNPNPQGDLYYTINGPDPKQEDDTLAPTAILYSGETLLLGQNSRLRLRVKLGEAWTDLVVGVYSFETPTLAVTEIMYKPSGGNNLEFVELFNYGDKPVRLHGLSFKRGIFLDFGGEYPEFLQPNEYAVVPNDLGTFSTVYDVSEMIIAGEYNATLSNISETVSLVGPVGEPIAEIEYQDSWYPLTDGNGHSLVLIDPETPLEELSNAESWRASFLRDGSPGREDTDPSARGGQIPGDSNQDGRLNLSDAIYLAFVLFRGDRALPCGDEINSVGNVIVLDANGDFLIDSTDIFHNLSYLFLAGPTPRQGTECRRVRNCPEVCEAPDE